MKIYKLIIVTIIFLLTNISNAISTTAKQAILIDASNGAILYGKNHKEKMPPSSMSKLMTIYIAFEKLQNNQIHLEDNFMTSINAWKKEGSKMFLSPNKEVTVENLIKGIIIQSGNDASIALAEGIDGNEEDFVIRMNARAKEIGLTNSNFTNCTGWPNQSHYMTAYDLALLANKIMNDFPEYYHYFRETEFTYNKIKQLNRNILINKNIGVDGLKTGHTSAGGYGIVASATKNNRRLIVVVNGLKNEQEREKETRKLLQYGFLNFTNITVAKANIPLTSTRVWMGQEEKIGLATKNDIIISTSVEDKKNIKAKIKYQHMIKAPINKKISIGTLEVFTKNQKQLYPIYPLYDVGEAGYFSKIIKKTKFFLQNMKTTIPETTIEEKDILL